MLHRSPSWRIHWEYLRWLTCTPHCPVTGYRWTRWKLSDPQNYCCSEFSPGLQLQYSCMRRWSANNAFSKNQNRLKIHAWMGFKPLLDSSLVHFHMENYNVSHLRSTSIASWDINWYVKSSQKGTDVQVSLKIIMQWLYNNNNNNNNNDNNDNNNNNSSERVTFGLYVKMSLHANPFT